MTKTIKAPGLLAQVEGQEVETPSAGKGNRSVFEPNFTLTPAQAGIVRDWCARLAVEYAEQSAPIPDGDPRLDELDRVSRINHQGCTPEERANAYMFYVASWPAWPLPLPSWAVSSEVEEAMWPEVVVTFRAAEIEAGGLVMAVEQKLFVQALDFTYHDGEHRDAGDVHAEPCYIDFGATYNGDLELRDATAHAEGILRVVAAFRQALREPVAA